jgi:LysM repeat protein
MATIKLNIPYRSQWDPDAKDHSADCGPTSLAMLLGGLGDDISPDALYKYIGQREFSQYTSFADLGRAAQARNLKMTRKNLLRETALDELKAALKAGFAPIALINYAFWDPLVKNGFRGSHFILVTGYDDENIFVHDPLFRGNRREEGKFHAFTYKQFTDAWGGFRPGENPNFAVLIPDKAVGRVGGEAPKATKPVTGPLKPKRITLDEITRRRLLAKAAYEGLPDPDLKDAAVVETLVATLGEWGETVEQHTVARGENISKIATMYYLDKTKWPAIAKYNQLATPGQLKPGTVLQIPMPSATFLSEATVPLPGFGGPTG